MISARLVVFIFSYFLSFFLETSGNFKAKYFLVFNFS